MEHCVRAFRVRLYIRVRLPDGRHSFLCPAWNKNRTLRAGYALVAGQPEHHPEAVYYLRFLRGGKRVWQAVGHAPDRAIAALNNTEHDLRAAVLGRKTPDTAPTPHVESSQQAPQQAGATAAVSIQTGTPLVDAITTVSV